MDKLSLFTHFTNNIVTRKTLQGLTAYCSTCKKSRLEVALELALGYRSDACWKCRAAAKFVGAVLDRGAEAFNVTMDELREKFKDAYWRKGLASVIKGIAHFGVRKPFVPGAPFQVVWDVTYACNLRCKHCYATAGKALHDELTTDEALDLINRLDRLGVTIIAFSGGEPLVRKDIFELTSYAAEKGIYVAVATNGTLITEEKAKEMKENGVGYVQISLDGVKETHEAFRGIKGCFDRTVEGIKNAVKAGLFVNVSMTVTKFNYEDVPAVVELCEKLGVNWFMHYNFIPTGRGREIVESDIAPEQREELLKWLYKKNYSSNISLLSTAPQFARVALQCQGEIVPTHFYNVNAGERLRELAEFIGGCGAGRFYFAIKANGDIQPCVFFPLKVGNVREDDLEELWLHNHVFEDLRDKDLLEGCGSCSYRYVCGGCRARAYNYFGDYLKPDPGCVNNRKWWERVKEYELYYISGKSKRCC
ncbi:MAG: radical SAM protein [Archaeoglobus sp.]|uniref:radical SAM/SPASM domain-containing protein n=1 Tax=Archaeoglobus sp. TaxID=1872626 RepID=UPI001D8EE2BF|nr:radical SAM protein [Archaeoglobus sp.]MBO8180320.1 radical SAM protein [Archaeoglobus sp.]